MSYIRHHSILVSSFDKSVLKEAHIIANKTFIDHVSEVVEANGCMSFFIAPDGAKEDQKKSKTGDAARAEFVKWLQQKKHNGVLKWVELFFGEDHGAPVITQDSEQEQRRRQAAKKGLIQTDDY